MNRVWTGFDAEQRATYDFARHVLEFKPVTAAALVAEGFGNAADFTKLDEELVKTLCKNLRHKTADFANGVRCTVVDESLLGKAVLLAKHNRDCSRVPSFTDITQTRMEEYNEYVKSVKKSFGNQAAVGSMPSLKLSKNS